ncbi:MAG: hypothetical protein ACJARV_000722, partial [Candidatus Pseudothioglobus sp.]
WIAENKLSASVRLNKVIPINADIRNRESKKRLGAIFLNISRQSTEEVKKIR